jgi:hypothetical protein
VKKPKGDRRKKSDRRATQRDDTQRRTGQERRTDVSAGSSMRAEPNLTNALKTILKENSSDDLKAVDSSETTRVDSRSLDSTSMTSTGNDAQHKEIAMNGTQQTVTLTRSTKDRKSTSVVFTNASLRGSVRVAKTYFGDDMPETIEISGVFAAPKVKMTAEERKAARKNAPKLSAAEKLAKLQERAARLQKKIEAENAQPAAAQ